VVLHEQRNTALIVARNIPAISSGVMVNIIQIVLSVVLFIILLFHESAKTGFLKEGAIGRNITARCLKK
jgi:hypothetical protein